MDFSNQQLLPPSSNQAWYHGDHATPQQLQVREDATDLRGAQDQLTGTMQGNLLEDVWWQGFWPEWIFDV